MDLEVGTLTLRQGKARRVDVLPLHPQLAEALRALPRGLPSAKVWPTVVSDRTRHRDFEAAGIPAEDEQGRVVDLHALRTTLGTQLARAGVSPAVAQKLIRHGDYRTTLKHYTVLGLMDTAQALDRLPRIEARRRAQVPARQKCKNTRR